jgi:hypothetical protein
MSDRKRSYSDMQNNDYSNNKKFKYDDRNYERKENYDRKDNERRENYDRRDNNRDNHERRESYDRRDNNRDNNERRENYDRRDNDRNDNRGNDNRRNDNRRNDNRGKGGGRGFRGGRGGGRGGKGRSMVKKYDPNTPHYDNGNYPNYYDEIFRCVKNDKRVSYLKNLPKIFENKTKLLDIGCNTGEFTNQIALCTSKNCKISAIDIGIYIF